MNKKETDIELIAKYYNGELNGKAMQELEERALDDPFLAEAMDGFNEFSIKTNDFIELNERLKERIRGQSEKRAVTFGFSNWTIAASIIILIGFISIYINLPDEQKTNTINDLPETVKIPDVEKEQTVEDLYKDTVLGKQEIIDQSPIIVSLENQDSEIREEIASLDQIVLQPLPSSSGASDSLAQESLSRVYNSRSLEDFTDNNSAMVSGNSQVIAVRRSSKSINNVKGKVIDSENKEPIQGVTIRDNKTGTIATTDINGEFKIPTESETKLSINFIGYQKKEMEVLEGDSINISLKPVMSSLSEVVVIGYGSKKIRQSAGPKDGWAAFRKYLSENDELETNETGEVVVEFVINSNGSLSDFKILQSLSKLADARAIYLIKNYSSWKGSSDGKAHKAKVTLRFK